MRVSVIVPITRPEGARRTLESLGKQQTRHEVEVLAVLLSGNHGKIAQWRRHEQYRRTAERRPDLLEEFDAGKLSRPDRTALADLGYDVVDGRLKRRPDADGGPGA